MIKSMTGFGRAKYENEGRNYTVEIKSVNHKYSDINIKLPRFLNYLEDKIRKTISNSISRGKIDVFISFENYSDKGTNIKINRELAKQYLKELRELADETNIDFRVSVIDVSKFPEILKIEDDENEEIIEVEVLKAVEEALDMFIKMREIERQKLAIDIEERIEDIKNKVNKIEEASKNIVEDYVEKLEARVNELLKTSVIDETRIAQEIVIYSDKTSIEEELTRLKSHLDQFINMLKLSSPIGKKMDFLVQEINRETNTIGSKANSLEITNLVVEIKTEVENIREQIQNIE